jgi:hypothetical protein
MNIQKWHLTVGSKFHMKYFQEYVQLSIYDGTSRLDNFLVSMEEKVVEDQRISVLDLALRDTPTRWWTTHKALVGSLNDVKQDIKYRIQDEEKLESEMQIDFQVAQLFNG